MKVDQSYGRKRIEPVLLDSLDDLTTEKVPRARTYPWSRRTDCPNGELWTIDHGISVRLVAPFHRYLLWIKSQKFRAHYKRWKTKNYQFERNFIESKIISRKRTFKCEEMETLSGIKSTLGWIQVKTTSSTDRPDIHEAVWLQTPFDPFPPRADWYQVVKLLLYCTEQSKSGRQRANLFFKYPQRFL